MKKNETNKPCPHCGSSETTELPHNGFNCNNCGYVE